MFTSSQEVINDHNRWNGLLKAKPEITGPAIERVVSTMKESSYVQSDPSAINRAVNRLKNGVDTPLDYKVAY